ncbi:MAG: uroporphyrinogen-III synthase [Acetobacteraceae bacterium]|jgi:uroporphyrinogen-III synthase
MRSEQAADAGAGRPGPAQHAAGEAEPRAERTTAAGSLRDVAAQRGPGVLITRPQPGAGETAARVASLGFAPILVPVIRIEPTLTHLPAAASLAAVLVTSGNAVDALPLAYRATRMVAVGDATAERARAAGFTQVLSAAGDAEALALYVTRHQSPKDGTLLLASGHLQGKALATALRQAGYRVARRVVYAALPARDLTPGAIVALRAGGVRAALFFSAETARQFVRLVQRAGLAETLTGVDAISIGRPAAVALEELPWRDVRVAARPTQDEMLALLR